MAAARSPFSLPGNVARLRQLLVFGFLQLIIKRPTAMRGIDAGPNKTIIEHLSASVVGAPSHRMMEARESPASRSSASTQPKSSDGRSCRRHTQATESRIGIV